MSDNKGNAQQHSSESSCLKRLRCLTYSQSLYRESESLSRTLIRITWSPVFTLAPEVTSWLTAKKCILLSLNRWKALLHNGRLSHSGQQNGRKVSVYARLLDFPIKYSLSPHPDVFTLEWYTQEDMVLPSVTAADRSFFCELSAGRANSGSLKWSQLDLFSPFWTILPYSSFYSKHSNFVMGQYCLLCSGKMQGNTTTLLPTTKLPHSQFLLFYYLIKVILLCIFQKVPGRKVWCK